MLRWVFETKVRVGGTRADGRVYMEIAGAHIEALAGQLGGFGGRIEVFEPPELREQLAVIGKQLCELYGSHPGSRP